ncbi:MAG: hypothetical protein ABIJ47_08005 [Candidatus Bathyarchaeota archaeon]
MSYLNKFDKCELEPNILCDMEYNCLNCAKQENRWAEIWIKGPAKIVEAEADEKSEVRVPAKSLSTR